MKSSTHIHMPKIHIFSKIIFGWNVICRHWNGKMFYRKFCASKSFSMNTVATVELVNKRNTRALHVCVCMKVCICFRSNFHVNSSGMGQVLRKTFLEWQLVRWVRVSGIFAVKYVNFSVSLSKKKTKKCGPLWQKCWESSFIDGKNHQNT